MIQERLALLRRAMAEKGLDAYLIPQADYHGSEYVGDHFKIRAFFSGFTGSAGTLAVTAKKAGLWTDSRYFLQAEAELAGTGIDLYRMGQEGVPTLDAFLKAELPPEGTLGADGRMVSAARGLELEKKLPGRTLAFSEDLAGLLWTDRPPLPKAPVFILEERYAGKSAREKLAQLREQMGEAEVHLLTALDQIAWLLNIRGGDVQCNPVPLAYGLVERERMLLFIDREKLSPAVMDYLTGLQVEVRPYEAIGEALDGCAGKRVLLSTKEVNYALYSRLAGCAEIVDKDSPVLHAKAVKDPVEQENLRRAHVKDGVALAKLLYQLKTGRGPQTETAVAAEIDALRREQEGCIGPSFTTIAGYGPHAAIVHYHATEDSSIPLERKGLLLLDSGGQYYEGTTDVTRTIALGPVTAEEKKHFTLVLQGMLDLSAAVFPKGCCGFHLDALARSPLWRQGLDFGHGTGHGIGYMLCVHEPPIGFSFRRTARYDTERLLPGMVISDEPGVYIEGSHGVRIENQLLCRESDMPGFFCFETLTLVPIDRDAIDLKWLDAAGRERLDAYHQRVYAAIAPHLTEDERRWLKEATRPL